MGRVNVSLPDELLEWARRALPDLNFSEVLRRGLAAALACDHAELACSCCLAPVARRAIVDDALGLFYGDALDAIDRLVQTGGTCEGAARVLKDVAGRHQVAKAELLPLPRLSRGQRRHLEDQAYERRSA
jgi:post-segregation antitoxin (ccd killing protein)